MCIFIWLLRLPARVKTNSHWVHLWFFLPLWVFRCVFKFSVLIEENSHWLHLKGLSPVCVFRCNFIRPWWFDVWLHWLHLYKFSRLDLFRNFSRLHEWQEGNLQWLQFSNLSLMICVFRAILGSPISYTDVAKVTLHYGAINNIFRESENSCIDHGCD